MLRISVPTMIAIGLGISLIVTILMAFTLRNTNPTANNQVSSDNQPSQTSVEQKFNYETNHQTAHQENAVSFNQFSQQVPHNEISHTQQKSSSAYAVPAHSRDYQTAPQSNSPVLNAAKNKAKAPINHIQFPSTGRQISSTTAFANMLKAWNVTYSS